MTEAQNNRDDLPPEQDDEIIGTAFRWSVLAFAVAAVIIATVIFSRGGEEAAPVVSETEARAPEQLSRMSDHAPTAVRFVDVTDQWGIDFAHNPGGDGERMLPETMGSGVALFDFDNDGDMDLFFVNAKDWPWQQDKRGSQFGLFRNDGEGKFTDIGQMAGVPQGVYGMGVAAGDYDLDGYTDLLVTTVGRNLLLRNVGGEKLIDVTEQAGVRGDDDAWSTSAAFFDADRDGDLDLYVANYVEWSRDIDLEVDYQLTGIGRAFGPPANYAGTQDYFYLNNGDGTFKDESSRVEVFNPATGLAMGKGLAVVPVDINHDGWQDLIVANDTVRNFAFMNLEGQGFEELGADLGLAFDNAGHATGAMGIDAAAYRNDGDLAVAIGNFSNEMTSFYVAQDGVDLFTDEAILSGVGPDSRHALSFGLFFFDYDLDGRLDLFQTNGHVEPEINVVQPSQHYRQPSQLFWNCGDDCQRLFVLVPPDETGDLATPVVGRGAAYGDLDGDGDLDIVVTRIGERPLVLRNDQQTGNHWLRLHFGSGLEGRSPYGARVRLTAGGQTQTRVLNPSRSYLSQVEPVLTFGLGEIENIDELAVNWPDGRTSKIAVEAVDREIYPEWPK